MGEVFTNLFTFEGGAGIIPFTILSAFIIWWYHSKAMEKTCSRKSLIHNAKDETWRSNYHHWLSLGLNWLDIRLLKEAADTPFQPSIATFLYRAFHWRTLNLCLILAIAYPLLSILLPWAFDGHGKSIGKFDILPAQPEALRRWSAIFFLIGSNFLLYYSLQNIKKLSPIRSKYKHSVFSIFTQAFLLTGLGTFAFAKIGALIDTDETLGIFMIPGALAFTIILASHSTISFTITATIASAFAINIGNITALASAIDLSFAFSFLGSNYVSTAICLSIFIAFVTTLIVTYVSSNSKITFFNITPQNIHTKVSTSFLIIIGLIFYTLLFLMPLQLIAEFSRGQISHTEPEKDFYGLLVFFLILPLINAFFDYISLGFTRFSLRMGSRKGHSPLNPWFWSVIDVLFASFTIYVLSVVLILAFDNIRFGGDAALLHIPNFIAELKANPSEYWWVYLMLFSTFVPSVMHFCIALFAPVTLLPKSWGIGRRIADNLNNFEHDGVAEIKAKLALVAIYTLVWVLPFILIWLLFKFIILPNYTWVGQNYLDAVIWMCNLSA